MPSLQTLHDLFLHELKDLASAEEQLVKALPKMAAAAKSPGLATAFTEHLQETEGHLLSVTRLLESFGESKGRRKCIAMAGLIAEGQEMIQERAAPAVHDAALISAAQRVEHYEIAGYGTLRAWAQLMGHQEAAGAIEAILNQEKAADGKLTLLALQINPMAEERPSRDGPVVIMGRRKGAAAAD
ncbi:MAG TPA: ferritin-like domain-containing protein [Phycisphaerales bacterium]|nr:ferritin-like domain-containing protein [Phycisphaerales bacterium]